MTPTARAAQQIAVERNIGSIAGRALFSRGPLPSQSLSASTIK
jgi:hypothetical protein